MTASDDPRKRLEELVASAGLCWAADRRQAAELLLAQALTTAREVAEDLPGESPPAERLAGLLRRPKRAVEPLKRAFDGADLGDPRVFGRTHAALDRVTRAVRLLDPRARRRRRILGAFGAILGSAVAVAIVLVILANVDRPEDRIFGGGGGHPYEVRCRPGARIVGADVFLEGTLVSGIRPHCLAPPADAGGAPIAAGMVGRRTPNPQTLRCPPGMLAVGISGRAGARLDRFTLLCGPHDDPSRVTHELGGAGGAGGTYYRARCSEGSIVGLRGNAGAAVDSVGAICVGNADL